MSTTEPVQALQNGIENVKETQVTETNGDLSVAVPPPEEEPPKIEEIVTPDVLDQIIKGYNPELSLVSWKAELGSKVGDNYMSILYAVELELENKQENGRKETLKLMLKTLPRNAFRADMISEMKAFKVETIIYQDVLSLLIKIQEENGISNENLFQAWPKCYAVHLDGHSDYLAIEDLKVSRYTMGNRLVGLDFNHCSTVLRTMAKFHAISYAKYGGVRSKILEDFPLLTIHMFDKTNKVHEMQEKFFISTLKTLEGTLKGMGEDLASSRAAKLAEVEISSMLEDLTNKDIECAVIIHGDCWINNMMFKYSEKDTKLTCPLDVKFIDFQISMASSRLVDVYYFLMTSSKLEVLNEREEDLLMIYFAEFTSFAERLGVNTKDNGLTWENLLKEAEKYKLYGVIFALLFAPMLGAESKDIPDMETFTQEDFENSDEAVQKFCKDLTNGRVMNKIKNILLRHLPKCSNVEQFL